MSDKKGFNSIVPDQDERIGARAASATGRPAKSRPIPAAGNAPRNSGGGGAGGVWKFLVVVLFLATAAVSWFGWQQYQQLTMLQASFDNLNERLTSTDDSLSQSEGALRLTINDQKKTLEKHWSEIRKLWGVSNDRNKNKIDKNLKTATSNKQRITKLEKGSDKLAEVAKQQGLNSKQIADVSNSTLGISVDIESIQQRLQSAANQLSTIEQSLKRWQSEVNGRLDKNDEAIDAIDSYRRQVNQELLQLRNQLTGGTAAQ